MPVEPTRLATQPMRTPQPLPTAQAYETPISLAALPGYQKWWQGFLQMQAAREQQLTQAMHNLSPMANPLVSPNYQSIANAHQQAIANYMMSNPMGSYVPPQQQQQQQPPQGGS